MFNKAQDKFRISERTMPDKAFSWQLSVVPKVVHIFFLSKRNYNKTVKMQGKITHRETHHLNNNANNRTLCKRGIQKIWWQVGFLCFFVPVCRFLYFDYLDSSPLLFLQCFSPCTEDCLTTTTSRWIQALSFGSPALPLPLFQLAMPCLLAFSVSPTSAMGMGIIKTTNTLTW